MEDGDYCAPGVLGFADCVSVSVTAMVDAAAASLVRPWVMLMMSYS